jgi:hypothetical protein
VEQVPSGVMFVGFPWTWRLLLVCLMIELQLNELINGFLNLISSI